MQKTPFDLPDEARLWAYVADRSLSEREQEKLLDKLCAFFEDWTTHGRPVRGEATLLDDRLLLVGGMAQGEGISGCGIDASVNVVEEAGAEAGVSWISPLTVVYRDDEGRVQTASRPAFRELAEAGRVTGATPVFDLSVDTVGALRQGALERPAADAWHARAFDLADAAVELG